MKHEWEKMDIPQMCICRACGLIMPTPVNTDCDRSEVGQTDA